MKTRPPAIGNSGGKVLGRNLFQDFTAYDFNSKMDAFLAVFHEIWQCSHAFKYFLSISYFHCI